IAADLHKHRANVMEPAQGFEGHKAGVADDDQSLEPAGRTVVPAGLPFVEDAVVDHEVTSMDVDLEAIAVSEADAVARWLGSLRLHTKPTFRVPCPRAVGAVAGAI